MTGDPDKIDYESLSRRLEAARTANMDQMIMAGREMAMATKAVYDGFVEAGFSKKDAMDLARAFLIEGVRGAIDAQRNGGGS